MLVTEASETETILEGAGTSRTRQKELRPASEAWNGGDFQRRHIGPNREEAQQMLGLLGFSSLDALVDEAVPRQIRSARPLQITPGSGEQEVLRSLKELAAQNQVFRSYIGMGYYDCHTPAVIQRTLF